MGHQINPDYSLKVKGSADFFFEMGPIRPPSEGQDHSLLLRTSRNCSWNRCEFCATYKGKKFSYRHVEEIKRDIQVAKALYDAIKTASRSMGLNGRVTQEVVQAIGAGNPHIYLEGGDQELAARRWQNLVNVANWVNSGANTVFLQDADALVMRTPELVAVIRYLKETFPSVERVTSYGRSKSCLRKSPEELQEIHQAGLIRVHVGLESGCDEVLQFMGKGVTAQEQVLAGKKVVDAGISLSEYVMPGLGGKKWSTKHALASAAALSEIAPDFIRLRSLALRRNSPLLAKREAGQFAELSEDEVVEEIGLFLENLQCRAYLVSDQMANLLFEVEGQLPQDKERMLQVIARYRHKLPLGKVAFRLRQRLQSYLAVYGCLSPELQQQVQEAWEALQQERPEAQAKADAAISALKEGFI